MKKVPANPTPASSPFWFLLALASLAVNACLVIGWLGRSRAEPPATPSVVAAAPQGPAIPATWPREIAPYAALGSFMAENNRIPDLHWRPEQFEAFQQGFRASYEGRGLPLDDAAVRLRDEINQRVQAMAEATRADPVQDYFRFLREKENVKQTASGLHYRITEEAAGDAPRAGDSVVISYSARLPDGKKLPTLSRSRVKVPLRDLLPGLAEGVQLLHVGSKALLYLPPALAFSEATWPEEIPRGAPVVFFVELHDIQRAP